jgi:hypothetical protein
LYDDHLSDFEVSVWGNSIQFGAQQNQPTIPGFFGFEGVGKTFCFVIRIGCDQESRSSAVTALHRTGILFAALPHEGVEDTYVTPHNFFFHWIHQQIVEAK